MDATELYLEALLSTTASQCVQTDIETDLDVDLHARGHVCLLALCAERAWELRHPRSKEHV